MSSVAAMPIAEQPSGRSAARETGSRPLRVAYIMSRFPKLTETFVLDEIVGLAKRGVDVEVFPLWREQTTVMHQEARAVVERAHFLPTLSVSILGDNLRAFLAAPGRYLSTLGTLIRANVKSPRFLAGALAIFPKSISFSRRMRELGVEHVHAHFASHPAASAFVVGRMAKIPYSFTAHGSDLHREQAMLEEKVRHARFVLAISDFNRRFILEHVDAGLADRLRVLHCGVDPALHETARGGDLQGSTFDLACVGTLHEVKGQRYLLEACAGLDREGIEWSCHLVGDGPDRAMLEARAEALGISSRVVFHGALDREGVRALLSRVDVSVAPSVPTSDGRREGIPVVLMEAAASGLPLVASRLSGIPEIVRDEENGLLVEPGDVDALTLALRRLSREPQTRARFGRAARATVESDFCLSKNLDRLERAFRGEAGAS